MHIIYDDINWSTYNVSGIGNITERRWYYHELTLPAVKGDDGYYYSAIAKPKPSSPQAGDDPDYEYVDITITYSFDLLGIYSQYDNKKYNKLLETSKSKGLPVTRTFRFKGEKCIQAATSMQLASSAKNSIHGNSLVKPGIDYKSINGNSINGINRGEIEDAASIVMGIAAGIIEQLSRSNNLSLPALTEAAKASNFEAQIAETTQLVKNALAAEDAYYNELIAKKLGWLPDGSSVKGELSKPFLSEKATMVAEINEAGSNAIRDIKVEQAAAEEMAKSLTKAKWLSRAGKILTGAGFALMFAELWICYCEQDHQKFKEAVYGFIANFAAAVGAGAILGMKYGSMAGVKGIVIGILVGVIIGIIDWAFLRLTEESLGHWIDVGIKKCCQAADYVITTLSRPVAEFAKPGVNQMLRQATDVGEGNFWDIIRSMGGGL